MRPALNTGGNKLIFDNLVDKLSVDNWNFGVTRVQVFSNKFCEVVNCNRFRTIVQTVVKSVLWTTCKKQHSLTRSAVGSCELR